MDLQEFKPEKKPKNSNNKIIKILLGVLGLLVAGAAVFFVLLMGIIKNDDASSLFVVDPVNNQNDTPQPTQTLAVSPSPGQTITPQPGDIYYNGEWYVKNENIVNILFLGIDTNTERRINMAGYRSDVIIVCAIDVDKNAATLISIPRDTRTTVQKVNKNTGEITEVLEWKINTAYSYGGGIDYLSFSNAMACVQMFLERNIELEEPLDFKLDIPVFHYASMDMDGIPHVASSVGGVPIKLEVGLPGVGSKGQTVNLKYDNAVTYLTDRHDVASGDIDRNRRQQKFLIALAKKVKDMDAPSIITSLYDDLKRYVHTDLDTTQMLDLAKVLMKTDIDSIKLCAVTGEGKKISGTYFMLHDEQATLDMLLDVYYTKAE